MSASMNPRIGMLARIRNRFGLIKSVTPNDSRSAEGIFHSVNIDYFDSETPSEETVIWERETNLHLSEPKSFPKVTDTNPMPLDLFRSLMHACQWSAMAPMLSKDQRPFISEKQPICSPVYGSIQVEDFQLYPVAKAMASSRVAMLIADDTGLGKTIEAGLLLTELIVKRRIRRVLVLCPPNLSEQWQDELSSKFGLNFDVIDLKSTTQHQKQHGLDANPWKGFDKIVTSFYYLKQPNVLEQFRAAAETSMASGKLPWDLLIVDEAHNLAPAPVGEPSDLYKMLKSVAPYFEHKVFLSATPHNGRTSSFSGLMEVLDPVKFMRKHELNATDKQNVSKATVRRLKSDINKICTPQRFANRSIATLINYPELNLKFDRAELDLFIAFQEFKEKIKLNIQKLDKTEKTTSLFAIQILQKRLLSCPYTFAFSWFKFLNGLKLKEEVGFNEVNASKKSYEKALNIENDDDNETEIKGANFVETTGAWLRNLNDKLGNDVQAVTDSLKKLGLVGGPDEQPIHDARYISLFNLIKKALISKETWLNDERIIVFTEYKTTLDYLERRLSKDFGNEVIATLYGQKPEVEKKKVYKDFNDPSSKIKILLATDAASEGLNLQESCRYVFHFDIPWNPIRLEQRNGRVDRHGQARDVTIFHFHSTDKDELSFLSKVFEKVDQIRNDLGSVADLFSGAISKFLVDNEKSNQIIEQMELQVNTRTFKMNSDLKSDLNSGMEDFKEFEEFKKNLDLSVATLTETGLAGAKKFKVFDYRGPDESLKYKLLADKTDKLWVSTVDDFLRKKIKDTQKGPLKEITFAPDCFIKNVNGRQIFKSNEDVAYLTIGQPLMQRMLREYMHIRYEGSNRSESRWATAEMALPKGVKAVFVLFVEELAINRIRETIHHWVRPMVFGLTNDELVPIDELAEFDLSQIKASTRYEEAKDLWVESEAALKTELKKHQDHIEKTILSYLPAKKDSTLAEIKALFQSRFGEIGARTKAENKQQVLSEMKQQLSPDIAESLAYGGEQLSFGEAIQTSLFDVPAKEDEVQKELERQYLREIQDLSELLLLLQKERERLVNDIIPKRFELDGDVKTFPVGAMVVLND